MIGPYALGMLKPVLLAPLVPLLFSSCALLGNVISTDPAVDSVGPLVVGKTLAVSGVVSGGPVSTSVPVPQLVNVVGGRGTVNDRDRLEALQSSRSGFASASYTNSSGYLTASGGVLNIDWIGANANGVAPKYTCTVTTFTLMPYSGVLTLRSGENSYRGTCTVDFE